MTEVIKYLEEIKEHQMQTVQLARSTEVYKLADKALKAIDVIQCCEQLKDNEIPTFEEWLAMNNYELYKNAEYKDENDCSWFSNELLRMYERETSL